MPKFKSIKTKFITSVLAVALILTLAIMGFIYFMVGGMLTNEVYDRITANVGYGAQRIDNWFIERRAGVDTMYYVFPVLPDDEVRFAALENLFSYIGFSNEHAIFGGGWTPTPGWYPTQRPWWRAAMENPYETVLSPLYIDADSLILSVTFSRFFGQIDGYDAVYAIDLFLPDVLDMVWDSIIIEGSYAFMADESGNIIAHTNNPDLLPTINPNADPSAYAEFTTTNMREVTAYRQYLENGYLQREVMPVRDDSGTVGTWHHRK